LVKVMGAVGEVVQRERRVVVLDSVRVSHNKISNFG
jgi:hypothetical protein